MFDERQVSDNVAEILQHLEGQTVMLSDTEQDFVLGCRLALETGGKLTAENQAEIIRIFRSLNHAEHNAVGGLAEGALSMQRVVKDLAGAIHMLSPQEQQFLQQMAGKVQGGVKLSIQEIEALVKIYGDKGF